MKETDALDEYILRHIDEEGEYLKALYRDTHVKLLRKSLGEYSKYIVTIRGVGYRFEDNV